MDLVIFTGWGFWGFSSFVWTCVSTFQPKSAQEYIAAVPVAKVEGNQVRWYELSFFFQDFFSFFLSYLSRFPHQWRWWWSSGASCHLREFEPWCGNVWILWTAIWTRRRWGKELCGFQTTHWPFLCSSSSSSLKKQYILFTETSFFSLVYFSRLDEHVPTLLYGGGGGELARPLSLCHIHNLPSISLLLVLLNQEPNPRSVLFTKIERKKPPPHRNQSNLVQPLCPRKVQAAKFDQKIFASLATH